MQLYEKAELMLKSKNMKKNHLAKKTGLASSTVTEFFKGRIKNPTINLLKAIASGLDMSFDEFIASLDKEDIDQIKSMETFCNTKDSMTSEELAEYLTTRSTIKENENDIINYQYNNLIEKIKKYNIFEEVSNFVDFTISKVDNIGSVNNSV